MRREIQPMIGQAWTGRHVVMLHCTYQNQLLNFYQSNHAPFEPPQSSCAETLSQFISIGYQIKAITPLSGNLIQYLLVL